MKATATNAFNVVVIGSAPTSDGGAWTGGMMNNGTQTATLTLYVICAAMQ